MTVRLRRGGMAAVVANNHLVPLSSPPGETRPAPRRRFRPPAPPVLAALISLLLVSGLSVVVTHAPEETASAAPAPVPATLPALMAAPSTTATTAPPPPPTTAEPRPRTQPTPPPKDERAPEPIVKVGEIRIPKIGLVHPIYEGVTLTVVDHGPGHWPGSARPGQLGNAVFAGHRVTHSHPFRKLDQLVPGDEIIFVTDAGTSTYRMTKQEIVNPSDTWIVTPTPNATVTMFACHPPGSARQRIVVRGDFVGRS